MACSTRCDNCKTGIEQNDDGLTKPTYCPPCVSELELAITALIDSNTARIECFEEGGCFIPTNNENPYTPPPTPPIPPEPPAPDCPAGVTFLEATPTELVLWRTFRSDASPLYVDPINEYNPSFMFWVRIDELGTIFEYNNLVFALGSYYWAYVRIWHDGADWKLSGVFHDLVGGNSAIGPFDDVLTGLPSSADNGCYCIGLTIQHSFYNYVKCNVYVNGVAAGNIDATGQGDYDQVYDWTGNPLGGLGSLCWMTRTEKGTGAISGGVGNIFIWGDNPPGLILTEADYLALYNGGDGYSYAELAAVVRPSDGLFFDDRLYQVYDFSVPPNGAGYYLNQSTLLFGSQDTIKLTAPQGSGTEDFAIVYP